MAAGDLGRRLAERRASLGLSIGDLASRAGLAPDYVANLEKSPWSDVPTSSMRALARALETTVEDLAGGSVLVPPGRGRADEQGVLDELTVEECERLIAPGGIGRVVLTDRRGPIALPVNFAVASGDIVFRTDNGGRFEGVGGEGIAFEVDKIDDALAEGWSVVIRGTPRVVRDEDERRSLSALGVRPWAGPRRDVFVRIETSEITGRRVRHL